MTQLEFRLVQPELEAPLESSALASVRWLGDVAGERVEQWRSDKKPINVCPSEGGEWGYTAFELPGGGYYELSVTMPRGADLSEQYKITEGETLRESMQLGKSPHEYLSWQRFAGVIPPESDQTEPTKFAHVKGFESKHISPPGKGEQPRLYIPEATSLQEDPWHQIELVARQGATNRLQLALPIRPDWASEDDTDYVTWFPRMPNYDEAHQLSDQLRSNTTEPNLLEDRFPRWVAVRCGNSTDLVSMPWVWWIERSDSYEGIRLVFSRGATHASGRESPGRTIVSVQDRLWFPLLEFLTSGRLSEATPLIESLLGNAQAMSMEEHLDADPEMALYAKRKGPILAVAGSIVLLAQSKTSELQVWDRWLNNLANWFPGIPDGLILLGYRRIQIAESGEQLKDAYELLERGIKHGVPFMSATIQMLSTALAQLGSDIPQANFMQKKIATVTACVDPNQPFTVLRLPTSR